MTMIERHTAGDTLDFLDTVDDYPATDGWTLKYVLVPRFTTPTQAVVTITATAEGSDYRVTVAAGTTAAWKAGVYTWSRFVEDASRRVSLGTGELEVLDDPEAATAGYDTRTDAQIALADLKAAMATFDAERPMVQEYQIAGRVMRFRSTEDILLRIRYWEREVETEKRRARIAAGLAPANKIFVRF